MIVSPRPADYETWEVVDAEQQASEEGVLQQAGRWAGEHPKFTVGCALGLGVLLGWLLKRR